MIKVKICKDNQGFIWKFIIKGHAGYRRNGEDIVCAGVSAIAYTAIGALDEMAGINSYIEDDGYMKCSIPNNINENTKNIVKIILEAMVIGFRQIEESYDKYVIVEEEEV